MTMTLISNNKSRLRVLAVFCTVLLCPFISTAQTPGTQSLTVSPTLFDIKAAPAQVWQSELRIINSNNFDLQVYATVVNFSAHGESGRPDFIPVVEGESQQQTLAEWVSIANEPIRVARQQTVTIPFSVAVPADAPPGGHYAAILVGTRPPESTGEQAPSVTTSQFVTALLFLRVDGTIREEAIVRSFTPNQKIVPDGTIDLQMRVENRGNVHIQPQGEIVIKNMWGKTRGLIPVNQKTHYGKVLQDSIREYQFSWTGDLTLADIGRYTASVTLAYGEDEKKFASAETSFWIIPYKTILLVFGLLAALGGIIMLAVRFYIRRMLQLAGIDPQTLKASRVREADADAIVLNRFEFTTAPVRQSVSRFTSRYTLDKTWLDKLKTITAYLYTIRYIILGAGLLLVILITIVSLIRNAQSDNRDFAVTINENNVETTLSSEEIYYEKIAALPRAYLREVPKDAADTITIAVINTSGKLGTGATMKRKLESYGLAVQTLSADFTRQDTRTVIVYTPDLEALALALSAELRGALISQTTATNSATSELLIYAGSDIITN